MALSKMPVEKAERITMPGFEDRSSPADSTPDDDEETSEAEEGAGAVVKAVEAPDD